MAELVDALGLGPSKVTLVEVRVLSHAQRKPALSGFLCAWEESKLPARTERYFGTGFAFARMRTADATAQNVIFNGIRLCEFNYIMN